MAQAQRYPTYNPKQAALVTALIERGRRGDQLRRYPRDSVPTVNEPAEAPPKQYPGYNRPTLDARANVDAPGDAPQRQYPVYNIERTPERDERLTGEGGAKLGARQVYPTYNRPAAEGGGAWDERLPDGTPATQVGIPSSWQRPYAKGPAQQRYDELLAGKATDRNGRLRSGAWTALEGPSQPTDSIGNALGQMAGRFLTGMLRPESDEEIGRQRELPRYRAAAAMEAAEEEEARKRAQATAELRKTNAEAANEEAKPGYDAEKAKAAREEAERDDILSQIRDLEEFDPDATDARTQAVVARAQRLGMTPLKKQKGETWSSYATRDGRIFKSSNRGKVEEVKDPSGQSYNVGRPREIAAKDLMPQVSAVFGLKGNDEIADLARSRVSKIHSKTRTVDVNPALLREGSPYRNADGTPNEQAIWKAIDDTTLNLRDAFPAVTDSEANDYEREAASVRQQLRGAQDERRRAAERFVGIVEQVSKNPPAQGREIPANDLMLALRAILDNKNARERSRDLENFFRELYQVKPR